MGHNSIEELSKFIIENQLKRSDKIILFNATISFYRHEKLQTLLSDVQIITFPDEMVLYILEFIKETYQEQELYSTNNYSFHLAAGSQLEVRNKHNMDHLLFTISPVEKKGV